jgi:hypothetical protein
VVEPTPLKNDGVGMMNFPIDGTNNPNVPNHQPATYLLVQNTCFLKNCSISHQKERKTKPYINLDLFFFLRENQIYLQ